MTPPTPPPEPRLTRYIRALTAVCLTLAAILLFIALSRTLTAGLAGDDTPPAPPPRTPAVCIPGWDC